MKHLKAYTFEELLCEIPELEKYKHSPGYCIQEIGQHLVKFAKQNKLSYLMLISPVFIFGHKHFLFEKLNSPISISNYNSLESLNDLRVKRYDEESGNNNHGGIEHFRD